MMNDIKKCQYGETAEYMIDILKHKGFDTYYAANLQEAKHKVLEIIPENVSIGLGGSITLEKMDILDTLRSNNYKLIDRYQECSHEQHIKFYREALLADYFLTGANAITKEGDIVCTDCSGNRVAAMIFGPAKVIVVVGVNKLVKNLDEALTRIKGIAPINARRNHHNTPCTVTGKCERCNQPESMCNYTGIIHNGKRFAGRITVIVIADEVGL
jgi:L-lactate utilization protein LutB